MWRDMIVTITVTITDTTAHAWVLWLLSLWASAHVLWLPIISILIVTKNEKIITGFANMVPKPALNANKRWEHGWHRRHRWRLWSRADAHSEHIQSRICNSCISCILYAVLPEFQIHEIDWCKTKVYFACNRFALFNVMNNSVRFSSSSELFSALELISFLARYMPFIIELMENFREIIEIRIDISSSLHRSNRRTNIYIDWKNRCQCCIEADYTQLQSTKQSKA